MDRADEIRLLLSALDSMEQEGPMDSDTLVRWMNLHQCLRKLLWAEYGRRGNEG